MIDNFFPINTILTHQKLLAMNTVILVLIIYLSPTLLILFMIYYREWRDRRLLKY